MIGEKPVKTIFTISLVIIVSLLVACNQPIVESTDIIETIVVTE
jgi:hypothetical protein